jgi:large subunit ribosomal protein L30
MTYAVIQIRSTINAKREVTDTLKMLNLHRVNNCTIVPKTNSYQGMLQKTKDYITWGEINEDTLKQLLTNISPPPKGKMETITKDLLTDKKKLKEITHPVIRLHPPHKGYRGIKKPYTMGGSLGYRGQEINELLMRMV